MWTLVDGRPRLLVQRLGKDTGLGPDNGTTLPRTPNVEQEVKTCRNQLAFISWQQQQLVAQAEARGYQQRHPAVPVSSRGCQASPSHAFGCSPAPKPPMAPVHLPSPQLRALCRSCRLPNNLNRFVSCFKFSYS